MARKDKKKTAEYSSAWRKRNPEKCRQYAKNHRLKHPEAVKARLERWRKVNGEHENTYRKAYYEKHKRRYKSYRLKNHFGITLEQKEAMINAQQGKCAICGNGFRFERDCHVDHNHSTNKIRGILCQNCNRGLGMFKDNKFILSNAVSYLERYA